MDKCSIVICNKTKNENGPKVKASNICQNPTLILGRNCLKSMFKIKKNWRNYAIRIMQKEIRSFLNWSPLVQVKKYLNLDWNWSVLFASVAILVQMVYSHFWGSFLALFDLCGTSKLQSPWISFTYDNFQNETLLFLFSHT